MSEEPKDGSNNNDKAMPTEVSKPETDVKMEVDDQSTTGAESNEHGRVERSKVEDKEDGNVDQAAPTSADDGKGDTGAQASGTKLASETAAVEMLKSFAVTYKLTLAAHRAVEQVCVYFCCL